MRGGGARPGGWTRLGGALRRDKQPWLPVAEQENAKEGARGRSVFDGLPAQEPRVLSHTTEGELSETETAIHGG